MDTCSLYFLNWVCCLEAAVTQSNVWDSLVWFMYRKKKCNAEHRWETTNPSNFHWTAWASPTWTRKKNPEMIPANTKGSWHFMQSRTNSMKQNQPVWKKKNSKNRWKSREWVQLEVKTRARQLKKHISREFVGPWLSAMRAKQTRRPGLTTSASVHLQGLLWKPWTREDSAERIGRGAVTETQNKRPIFLQTYYIFKKFVS